MTTRPQMSSLRRLAQANLPDNSVVPVAIDRGVTAQEAQSSLVAAELWVTESTIDLVVYGRHRGEGATRVFECA